MYPDCAKQDYLKLFRKLKGELNCCYICISMIATDMPFKFPVRLDFRMTNSSSRQAFPFSSTFSV